ncbi:interactor of constitutive active ROPs 4-like [Gossypium arboreum]|uniref:interactor of constitutive active ROPs 4-like n=1 Tax=Gossypium arboreum TaxID=29729 RepID=UPI00081908F3|nr:interactor of constitutive active ROPs 4-like [Gossypium arboreum]
MADKSFFVDMPQRQSPRGTHQVRLSSYDSKPLHHRPITDCSSLKLEDRRSPRGAPQSDPLNQKKLGTCIADLESQLGQAQEELKNLKDHLASVEATKKEAQQELENKTKKPKARETVEVNEKVSPKRTRDSKKSNCSIRDEDFVTNQTEADQNGTEMDIDNEPVRSTRPLAEIYERAQVATVEPSCFEELEAQQGWKQAMAEEISMIENNQTWQLVERPTNRKVIGVKWDYAACKPRRSVEISMHATHEQPRSSPCSPSYVDEL